MCHRNLHDPEKAEAAMKTLVSVAVFGLVPMPPMPNTWSSRDDLRVTSDDSDFLQLVYLPRAITERLATKEELARICNQLKKMYTEAA
jgi:hypothetical protein